MVLLSQHRNRWYSRGVDSATAALASSKKPTAKESHAATSAAEAAAWLDNPTTPNKRHTLAQQLAAEPEWKEEDADDFDNAN